MKKRLPPWIIALPVLLSSAPELTWAAEAIELAGRLTLPAGENPTDWRVLVSRELHADLPETNGEPAGTTPAADGSFALSVEGEGQHYVCAYAGTHLDVESVLSLPVAGGKLPDKPLELKPKPPRPRVELALLREDGTPLGQKVRVHLYNVHDELHADRETWTADTGTLALDRLPATPYDLWVETPTSTPPGGPAGVPAVLFRRLLVEPGEGTQRLELTVPTAGGVRGRLLLVDGKTPAAGHVIAVQTGTVPDADTPAEKRAAAYARGAVGCYAEAKVAPDGTFVLNGLTPGKHLLDVRRPGQRDAWCTFTDINVRPGQVTDLETLQVARNGWQYYFNRHDLDGWAESDFWGQREVRIENDRVVLSMGNDMTGINWTRDLPRLNYEVSLQAMRVDGEDFFCGLTFPVRKDPCTLVLGGWGGGVVGLSSLDGFDASENETCSFRQFMSRHWYRVRLRVTDTRIAAWLDQEPIVDIDIQGRQIGVRIECEPSVPFGVATWQTTGAVRDVRIRKLDY